MHKNKRASAHVNVTTSQAAHSICKLRYNDTSSTSSLRRATRRPPHTLSDCSDGQQRSSTQQRLARTIAQHDAREDSTASAAAQDDDDQNDDDKIDRKDEPDDECDYHDDCNQQQQQPAQLRAIPRAGPEARACWALARASGTLHKNMCGRVQKGGKGGCDHDVVDVVHLHTESWIWRR